MFCTKCGKEIPDGSQFCKFCGNKTLTKDAITSTRNQTNVSERVQEQDNYHINNNKTFKPKPENSSTVVIIMAMLVMS